MLIFTKRKRDQRVRKALFLLFGVVTLCKSGSPRMWVIVSSLAPKSARSKAALALGKQLLPFTFKRQEVLRSGNWLITLNMLVVSATLKARTLS